MGKEILPVLGSFYFNHLFSLDQESITSSVLIPPRTSVASCMIIVGSCGNIKGSKLMDSFFLILQLLLPNRRETAVTFDFHDIEIQVVLVFYTQQPERIRILPLP